jgi:hypothetical protein
MPSYIKTTKIPRCIRSKKYLSTAGKEPFYTDLRLRVLLIVDTVTEM